MKLSRLLSLSLVIGLAACSDGPSDVKGPPAPSIEVRATSVDSGGVLRVVAVAVNRSTVHLQVAPPECLGVAMVADPTGAGAVGLRMTPACAQNASTTDLPPGDSVVIIRAMPGRDLAQYSPGTYAVAVTVVSKTTNVVAWGGDVKLPLSSLPVLPPGDGPLTGTWIQPSVDAWTQLDLSQSGTRVVGYERVGTANFGLGLGYPTPITGTAALPQATLEFTDGVHVTMNTTLSANGDTLTGTWSVGGGSPTRFNPFYRRR